MYANLCSFDTTNINIGDYLKFLTIDYVYDLMGIKDVVYLTPKECMDYAGEALILPTFFLPGIKNGSINISNKITPIILSLSLPSVSYQFDADSFFSKHENVQYLLKHSPIGCRNEYTYNLLTEHGVPAYIAGCLTVVFPKRENVNPTKVVLVDTPLELLPYIPKDMLMNCEVTTQQYYFSNEEVTDYRQIFNFVRDRYDYIKNNATIVITSRLHVAMPCIAYGIPVILARDFVDQRFSFIEKYIPIYNKTQYHEINWNPKTPDVEDIKEMQLRLATARINNSAECMQSASSLTNMFLSRKASESYGDPHITMHKNMDRFMEFAKKFDSRTNDCFKYALWGVSESNASFWDVTIRQRFPNAKLVAILDSFKNGYCYGTAIQHPNTIENMPDVFILVCGVGAASAAQKLFARLRISNERYSFLTDAFILDKENYQ